MSATTQPTTRQPLTGEDIDDIIEHVNESHVTDLLYSVRAFTDITGPTHAQIMQVFADGMELEIDSPAGRSKQFLAFTTQAPPREAIVTTVRDAMQKLGMDAKPREAQWTVERSEPWTANMQRITFNLDGDERADWEPGYACRFGVPGHEHGRPYTLRSCSRGVATVDVYCHHSAAGEPTLGSQWAQGLQAGSSVNVRGGRHEHFPRFEELADEGPALLLGDETALPTIAALLDGWAHEQPVRVLLEVGEETEQAYLRDVCLPRQAHVSWLPKREANGENTSGQSISAMLDTLEVDPSAVWGALETSAAKALRRELRERFPNAEVKVAGYWRANEQG